MLSGFIELSKAWLSRFSGNGRILIGLSGGPDSVFLMHWLASLREELGLTLRAAHINYKLRDQDSDLDQQFCQRLAEGLEILLDIKICDLRARLDQPGNLQAIAREERMSYFRELAQKYNCQKIALGHTRDDHIETILANIIRGCGLDGLGGIEVCSGDIIRPLRFLTKAEILAYLDQRGIDYRVDRTNLGQEYSRNKIRNLLLPLISAEFNPRFPEALERLSRIASQASAFLEKEVSGFLRTKAERSWYGSVVIPVEAFSSLDSILRANLLKHLVEELGGQRRGVVRYDLIESALELASSSGGKCADLGGGVFMERGADCLIVFRSRASVPEVSLPESDRIALPDYNLELNLEWAEVCGPSDIKSDHWRACLDADKLGRRLSIRHFREGDRFRPLGLSVHKKLGDFFTDRKIPRALRAEIPLLVADNEIAWVIGHEYSDLFKVDAGTRQVLKLCARMIVTNVE